MRSISSPLDGFSSPFGARRLGGGVSPFTPASLFAGGAEGWLADGLDLNTLFEGSNGTTPATAANDPVGFRIDESEGAGYSDDEFTGIGSENVTNGSFRSGDLTGWSDISLGTGVVTPSVGFVELFRENPSNNGTISQTLTLVLNSYYVYSYVVSGSTAFVRDINNDGSAKVAGGYSGIIRRDAAGSDSIVFACSSNGGSTVITGVSVQKIPGNHATQATTTFKPKYQTAGLTYDGSDDRLVSTLNPTTSGSIAARFNGTTASRVIAGSQSASDGRCFLALDASGKLAAGIGAQSTSTITGGADIRSADHVGVVTWDGSTVKLYLDGTEIYSAAQSGAVNTTVPIYEGALNANGTASAFWTGSISDSLIINRVLTPTEITKLSTSWSS